VSLFGPPAPQKPASSNLFPLDPIPITGADVAVQLAGFVFAPGRVLLDNESPYLLRVTIGGGRFYLRAWTSNVFPTGGSAEMQVHPIALTTPLPLSPSASLLVTLVPHGEEVPGIYPMEATRQANSGVAQGVRINITTPIVAAALAGATQIVVADARNFVIADPIFLDRQSGGGTFGGFVISAIVLNGDGTWTLTLSSGLPAGGVNPGDVIVLSPTVRLDFSETTVNVNQVNLPTTTAYAARAAVGAQSLVAGVGGQAIRVYGWNLENDAASAIAAIEDTSRASPAGRFAVAAFPANGYASGYLGGAPLPVGAGVQLSVLFIGAGGGGVAATMSYSQS
jgi:hypothetical protein